MQGFCGEEDADVLLVTRHFSMRWGGAEHSLAAVVEDLKIAQPKWLWAVSDGGFDPPGRLHSFPLIQRSLRQKAVQEIVAKFQGRLSLIQSLIGPAFVNALPRSVKTVFFVRDVRYWGAWPNYEIGVRRIAKTAYRLTMAPAIAALRREMRIALNCADLVIANSIFMADRIRAFSSRDSLLLYPRTPVEDFIGPTEEDVGTVGVIGDGADKGGLIFRALANRFPEIPFRLHAREVDKTPLPKNVTFAGWERDLKKLYSGLRLVLVPSQVSEAYGRVALEALGHGIPVLVSRVGGLPETVPHTDWTVSDWGNTEAWCASFAEAWRSAPSRRFEAHAFARSRKAMVDEQHRQLIQQLT
ncbi:hypothetical protein CCP3SC1AL1_560013 [Gammaproteobacteria bacterium]